MFSSYDLEVLAREQYDRLIRESELARLARRAREGRRRRRFESLLVLDRLRRLLSERRLDAPVEVSVEEAR